MENNYILSCESTADLPLSYMTERNISVLCYTYTINDEPVVDSMLMDQTARERLHSALVSPDAVVKTSQINIGEYLDYFEGLLQKGDVLHVAFNSAMTGSIRNANEAAEELREKYPDRKIIIADSLCCAGGYGMLMDYAADMRDSGYTLEQMEQWIIENRNKVHHHFFNADLKYFRKSGRLSGAAAAIATILNIVPVMRVDDRGRLIAYDKVRGKQAAINRMLDIMVRHAENGKEYSGKCIVDHTFNEEDAKKLFELIRVTFPNITDLRFLDIGDIISSHCGPGTVSFYFIGDERQPEGESV